MPSPSAHTRLLSCERDDCAVDTTLSISKKKTEKEPNDATTHDDGNGLRVQRASWLSVWIAAPIVRGETCMLTKANDDYQWQQQDGRIEGDKKRRDGRRRGVGGRYLQHYLKT